MDVRHFGINVNDAALKISEQAEILRKTRRRMPIAFPFDVQQLSGMMMDMFNRRLPDFHPAAQPNDRTSTSSRIDIFAGSKTGATYAGCLCSRIRHPFWPGKG